MEQCIKLKSYLVFTKAFNFLEAKLNQHMPCSNLVNLPNFFGLGYTLLCMSLCNLNTNINNFLTILFIYCNNYIDMP